MFPGSRLLLAFMACVAFNATAYCGRIEQRSFNSRNYQGSQDRDYKIFVPSGYTGQAPVPMVMVLHGCRQTEQDMINDTRFKELAERDNFIVVYPFVTHYPPFPMRDVNCWGFFIDEQIHKGAGEVEDLYQIALDVEGAFNIDPNRRFVTGLSSGAGMAVALGVARSEHFAAAGSVEGLPYAETSSSVGFTCFNPGIFKPVSADVSAMKTEQSTPEEQRPVAMMAIHSTNDCVVNIKGSENIRDAWIGRYGLDQTPLKTTDCTAKGVNCSQQAYGSAGRSAVETVFYDGEHGDLIGNGSHYWVGDNNGSFANPKGPSASELLWAFFKDHPLAPAPPSSSARSEPSNAAPSTAIQPASSGPRTKAGDVQSITADWQSHVDAHRIRVYGAPCPSIGFGACDAGFSEIYLANQSNAFPLMRKGISSDWYLHKENIP